MMRARQEEGWVRGLLFATDLLLYALALRLAVLSVLPVLPSIDYMLLERDRLICLAVFAVVAFSLGCYDSRRITDKFDSVYYILLAVGVTLVLVLALATLTAQDVRVISRRELVFSVPIAALLLTIWRHFAAVHLTRFRSLHRRVHVVGDAEEGARIARVINNDPGVRADAEYISFETLQERFEHRQWAAAETQPPEDLIIELNESNRGRLTEMLSFSEKRFGRIFLYPSFDDLMLFDHGKVLAIAGIPLVEVAGMGPSYPYLHVKRAMDIALASAGLVLAAPICLVTAIAIKLSSPGPVLYSQERLGKGARPFKIYKFRSMRADLQIKDAAGHKLSEREDPRITPVGRFIRKHRIDEIPQLINVLAGDMSLIGPRPVWREFYEANRSSLPLVDLRLMVRPGITSLSHILGAYTSDPRDRLRYDLVYIGTLSLMLDMKILFETVRIVVSGKGAQ